MDTALDVAPSAVDMTTFKNNVSSYLSAAVREHSPQVISRRGDDDVAVLLSAQQLLHRVLERFTLEVTVTVDEGEFVATLDDLGLIGSGQTFTDAMADLQAAVDEHVVDYFERQRFYEQTNQAQFYPHLLRYRMTPSDQRATLLMGTMHAVADVHAGS